MLPTLSRVLSAHFALLTAWLAVAESRAQLSWIGAGTSGAPAVWNDLNNWTGGVPVSSGTYALTFLNSGASYSQNNLTSLTLSSLTFDATAQTNELTGNAVTLSGDVTVSSTAAQTVALATTLASGNRNFTVNSGPLTWSAALSGTGALVKSGSGTLILSATNTFSGGTTINAGTLQISASGVGGTGAIRGSVTVNSGATLLITAQDALGYNSGTKVDTLVIAGGTVTHQASGNLTLANVAVSLTGGTLQSTSTGEIDFFDLNAATTTTGNTTITTNASATTSLIAGSIRLRQGNSDPTGTVFTVADGAAAVDLHVSANLTEGAAQSIASAITKAGSGLMLLSGTNNYTGPTTVSAGTLRAGSTQAFGSNSAVSLANTSGALLDLNNFNNSLGALSGGGTTGGHVSLGSAILTVGGANTSPGAYAGVISGTGSLVKTGTGTLQLTGFNTFSGGTTINAGTLQLNASGGGGTGILRGTVTVNSGGTLLTTAQDAFGWRSGERVTTLNINGGTVTHSSANNLSLAAATINLTGGTLQSTHASGRIDWLVDSGTGVKTSVNSLASDTLSSIGGTIWLRQGDSNLTGTIITVANGSAPVDLQISANLINYSTASAISKAGYGTLLLSGSNTYTGATFINEGTLQIGSTTALPSGSALTLANGATLAMQGFSASAASLNFAGGARVSFNLGTPGTTLLALSGALNKSGSGSYFLDFSGGQLGTYRLSTFSSSTFSTGDFTLSFGAGYAGSLSLGGTTLDLTITAIPEPANIGWLAALGALGSAATRRPRRTQLS